MKIGLDLNQKLPPKLRDWNGVRIFEFPVSYSGRTYAEGKKISWRDGIAALWYIIKYNFFVRAD